MNDLIRVAVPVEARFARRHWRLSTVAAVLALTLSCLLVSPAAHAAPAPRLMSVAVGSAAAPLQIDFRPIVCPILNSLATGPFASFIAPFINSLRVAFGCIST